MQPFSRITGLLMIAALAASSAGAQALMLPATQNMEPAGCHGHTLPTPAQAPRSHQCCIAGHNHAIPGSLFSGLAPLPYFGLAGDTEQTIPADCFLSRLSLLIPSSHGSPGLIALRI